MIHHIMYLRLLCAVSLHTHTHCSLPPTRTTEYCHVCISFYWAHWSWTSSNFIIPAELCAVRTMQTCFEHVSCLTMDRTSQFLRAEEYIVWTLVVSCLWNYVLLHVYVCTHCLLCSSNHPAPCASLLTLPLPCKFQTAKRSKAPWHQIASVGLSFHRPRSSKSMRRLVTLCALILPLPSWSRLSRTISHSWL